MKRYPLWLRFVLWAFEATEERPVRRGPVECDCSGCEAERLATSEADVAHLRDAKAKT